MKSILIRGAKNSGKSTTIQAVCENLNPKKVYMLSDDLIESEIENIFNHTFIIEVNGKLILIVAGTPTEQDWKITDIYKHCQKLNLDIHFLIVAMRTFEKKDGFNTLKELEKISSIVLKEEITRIPGANFKKTKEWKDRIERIVNVVKNNL